MEILRPIVHETVWGGSRLQEFVSNNCKNKIGHLYSCIDTNSMQSVIVHGKYKGKSVNEWFCDNKKKYGLDQFLRFPVITALVDATDNLSIQVHPDDKTAKMLEGESFGKNESFYIIKAPSSGWMYNGCTAESKEEFERAIKNGECLKYIGRLDLEEGDYVYVEGGTLHAATKGSLSFEIEENCEHTYRFYDFDRCDSNGRKRPLQIEKALVALDLAKKSEVKKYKKGEKIKERLYETQIIDPSDGVYRNKTGDFSLMVLLNGEAVLHGLHILPGTAVILENSDTIDIDNQTWMMVKIKW